MTKRNLYTVNLNVRLVDANKELEGGEVVPACAWSLAAFINEDIPLGSVRRLLAGTHERLNGKVGLLDLETAFFAAVAELAPNKEG